MRHQVLPPLYAGSPRQAGRPALLAATALAALVATVQPAKAQNASTPEASPAAEQPSASPLEPAEAASADIVVTGSRVIREGFASPSPVTSLDAGELTQASPNAVEALAQLPALSATTTRASVGGSTAQGPGSFLNLRGLGSQRNLVLLDGRRVAPTNVRGDVDINLLPQALFSEVQVVTGGASAAYGSDAVAGVTNFILDTRFNGVKADLSAGITERNDGRFLRGSVAVGGSFANDRLHAIASFDFFDVNAAYSEKRDWANRHCAPIPVPGVNTGNQSATNPRQTVACDVRLTYAGYGGAIISGPLVTPEQGIEFGPNGAPEPFNYGSQRTNNFQVGGDGVSVGNWVNFSTPLQTLVGFGRLGFDVSDTVEAFAQLTVSSSESAYPQTIPFLYQTRAVTIFRENAFLPTGIGEEMDRLGVDSFQMGQVRPDWGLITANSSYRNYDAVVGIKGEFGGGWAWEAHYEHGRSRFEMEMTNQVNLANFYRAADAVVHPTTEEIVCQSSIADPGNGCVPVDLFGPDSVSPEGRAYIQGVLYNANRITQDAAAVSISGEPFSTWAGPVGMAVGAEWRQQKGVATSDPISQNQMDFSDIRGFPTVLEPQFGGWTTNNPKPLQGSSHVKEAFGEVLIPLARDAPFLYSLDLNGAVRVTDYSNSGTVTTWKAGAVWQPIADLRLRITQSRDIRAPSINELFAGTNEAPATVTDPFRGGASTNIKTLGSGNPSLRPEIADTFTAGVVLQPRAVRGLGLSVDYWDIKIADVLGTLNAQDTINRCFAGATELCPFLIRGADNVLANVLLPQLNLTAARAKGVDFELSYARPLGGDNRLGFRAIGSYLIERSTSTPTLAGVNYVDRVGDIGAGNPRWRLYLNTSYDAGPFGVTMLGRYVGPGKFNTTYIPGDIDDNDVRSHFWVDLALRYTLESLSGRPQVYVNIDNVFDRDPPLVTGTALTAAQTNPALYDTLGRTFSLGIRAQW